MLLIVRIRLILATWRACWSAGVIVVSAATAQADQPYTVSGFTGVDIFSRDTELGNSWMVDQVPNTSVLVGLRVGWLALPNVRPHRGANERTLGAGPWRRRPQLELEAEVKLAPAFTANGSSSTGEQSYFTPVFGWRAHAVASMRVVPWLRVHILAGAGGESIVSTSPYMADETDSLAYWGVGVRVAAKELSDDWRLRLDARHGLSAGRVETFASTVEIQLGIETSFGAAPVRRPATSMVAREPDKKLARAERCRRAFAAGDFNDNCLAIATDKLVQPPPAPLAADLQPIVDDHDLDDDAILDDADKCPDAAETPNGFLDSDGCPDLVPAALRDAPTVAFPRRSAKLGPMATGQLTDVANVLREATELKLTLVGHDAGGGKNAARLRERRITSIKWFLIDRGIATERINVSTESSSDTDQVERIELRISR